MAEELEDKVGRVRKKDYIAELEEQVARYCKIIPDFPKNEIKYQKTKMPVFKNNTERLIWIKEERRRCIYGYNGMCGKMYFYFNYCWIRNISGGRISPEYRVCDNEWFKEIEACYTNHNGLICVKRRRGGFSWKAAADALHDALFKKWFFIGMNSKTDRDSVALFRKVKFLYDNLPDFFRVRIASNTQMYMDFSSIWVNPNDPKDKRKRGNQSEILVVPPTDTAFEGQMLSKWICDEAGKIPNLPQLWSYTEDCMMEETIRKGIPVLFGTSGEIGKEGRGLKEMWDSAEVHNLKKFFFGGWMGILCDEYGNDEKEEAIRWIIYQRHKRRNISSKTYTDFVQKYPLSIAEAFSQASSGGVGDIVKINAQLANLSENPAKVKRGRFALDNDGNAKFIPDNLGKALIYIEPEKLRQGLYVAGCDPADHDDAYDEASDLSMYIMKKPDGSAPPLIVFEYTDRPSNLVEYYEQAMLALMYYNHTKVLIEDNRWRMIGYFKENGYGYLLQTAPVSYVRLMGGRPTKFGFHKGTATANYMEELVNEYIDDYYDEIPSKELLQECIEYGSKNTDRVIAFAATLMVLKEDKRKVRTMDGTTRPNYTPTFGLRRTSDGNIVRVKDVNDFRKKSQLESDIDKWTAK